MLRDVDEVLMMHLIELLKLKAAGKMDRKKSIILCEKKFVQTYILTI